jgi:hypothetical protein
MSILTEFVAEIKNGDPGNGDPLPSVTVTKNGVVSCVDKYA